MKIGDNMLYYFFEEREDDLKNNMLISFPLPLDGNKYIYMMISKILSMGCRKYKTKKELESKCKKLDNAIIFNDFYIKGDNLFLNFFLSFKKGKSYEEKEEVLSTFFQYINENLVVDGAFKEEYFNKSKSELLDIIYKKRKNPLEYGEEKVIGNLKYEELYGEVEENSVYKLNRISNEGLLRLWFEIKNNTSPYILVLGEEELKELARSIFKKFMRINKIMPRKIYKINEDYVEKVEHYNGEKNLLICCIKSKFNISNNYEKFLIAYNILLGKENSLIKLRMKSEGIKEQIYSEFDYINGIITISYEGAHEEINMVSNIIKEELEKVSFDEKDILGAMNKSLSYIENLYLDQYEYMNFLIKSKFVGYKDSIEKLKDKVKESTYKDISGAIESMKLIRTLKIIGVNKNFM